MKQYSIDHNFVDALFQYLMKRPMGEVEQLVNGLRQLEEIEPPTTKPPALDSDFPDLDDDLIDEDVDDVGTEPTATPEPEK